MRIEAVTVCVNHADFLAETAPLNMTSLERLIVVTTPEDEETREVCRKHSLEVLLTNDCFKDGPGFAKGYMVEAGMRQLSTDCWHLHLDSDIVLPGHTKMLLSMAQLNTQKLYGADRLLCRNWDHWQQLKNSGWLNSFPDYQCRIHPPEGFSLGTRFAGVNFGYVPIGYFQLAHSDSIEHNGFRQRGYPRKHGNAARTDVMYATKWDRNLRELLGELLVVHLESEPAPMGTNWDGRKTKKFGPQTIKFTTKSTPS